MALKFAFLPFKGAFEFVLSDEPVTPVVVGGGNLLLEDGFALLLESGDNLLLEGTTTSQSAILLENGSQLLLESGDVVLLEA